MGKLRVLFLAAVAAVMGACSSGSDNSLVSEGGTEPGGGESANVESLTLLTSSPQMPSDDSADVTITALVRDSNNNVMEDVGVVLSADSGSLSPDGTVTDENGALTATLSTAGDPRNRTIVVTGTAGGSVEAEVDVNVIGTTLTINGPTNLPLSDTGEYSIVLDDAGGTGIGNTQVEIASSNGNGISETPVMTDSVGRASFTLEANNGGLDTLSAAALGLESTLEVSVSGDSFTFTAPDEGTEIDLGVTQSISVAWEQNGQAVASRQIDFSATRGTLSSSQEITDGSGTATVTIEANTAGPAVITAVNDEGTSIQHDIEFVATTPDTLELQASPSTVSTNEQSQITAVVRDPDGNLVKNQTVNFSLTDSTNGSLSVGQATTDSQGRAQTVYNATNTTSSVEGVRIDATVQGTDPAVTDSVNLTVAQREVFISIGTGNEISESSTAQYRKEWVVQVTDAQGNGVDGVDVSISALSQRYWDGERVYADPPGQWITEPGQQALPEEGCPDEDINRNGILDTGEDQNGNDRIEAGNIATAAAQDGGGSTVTTDENGFALVDVFWPQEYAYWLEITLEARAAVEGSEHSEATTFVLPGLADDFTEQDTSPPGLESPFGTDGNCGTPPPPDGP